MTFDQWHKKYIDAGGNAFKDESWMRDRHARGHRPQDAAADSRWIFPSEFDRLIERVKMHKFEQARFGEIL